jgi:hypothetical protein
MAAARIGAYDAATARLTTDLRLKTPQLGMAPKFAGLLVAAIRGDLEAFRRFATELDLVGEPRKQTTIGLVESLMTGTDRPIEVIVNGVKRTAPVSKVRELKLSTVKFFTDERSVNNAERDRIFNSFLWHGPVVGSGSEAGTPLDQDGKRITSFEPEVRERSVDQAFFEWAMKKIVARR